MPQTGKGRAAAWAHCSGMISCTPVWAAQSRDCQHEECTMDPTRQPAGTRGALLIVPWPSGRNRSLGAGAGSSRRRRLEELRTPSRPRSATWKPSRSTATSTLLAAARRAARRGRLPARGAAPRPAGRRARVPAGRGPAGGGPRGVRRADANDERPRGRRAAAWRFLSAPSGTALREPLSSASTAGARTGSTRRPSTDLRAAGRCRFLPARSSPASARR